MSDKIYCYPNSDILINKLNIHDSIKLQNIHKYIFQDIYSWAGKIRTVDIAKSNMFCKVQFIEMQASELFGKLQNDDYLKHLPKEKFVPKAAYYFSEINALHPFREGNGRTQRELIRQLAYESGYILHFAVISEKEMVEASIDSFICDYKKMEALFTKITEVR